MLEAWFELGRAVVTKGQRRLGKTIRILESSVEFSAKESQAKMAEKQYREKAKPADSEDSPIEDLRDAFNRRKDAASK